MTRSARDRHLRDRDLRIGERIAFYRQLAGLSQARLGALTGLSQQYISAIETGDRPATDRPMSLLANLAAALGVRIEDLTGQPQQPITKAEYAAYATVPAIRRAFDDPQLGPLAGGPRQASALLADAMTMMSARMAGRWDLLADRLPGLLAESTIAAESGDETAERAYITTLVACDYAVRLLGYLDLGRLLAERARDRALALGDPEYLGAATFGVAQGLLAGGARGPSLLMASALADELADHGESPGAAEWAVMMRLHTALSAGSLGLAVEARSHILAALDLAGRVTSDLWSMEPTTSNVRTWDVAIALEDGDAERAPSLARLVDRARLRHVDRRARLYFDTARGHHARQDYDAAVAALLAADCEYPLMLWTKEQAYEVVGDIVRRARLGGVSSGLATLCGRLGVDPASPPGPDTLISL